MTIGIYSITSPSGKQYIGSSLDIRKRWIQHKARLKSGNHHAYKLQSAYKKYGLGNLKFEILDECSPENLIKLEQMYLTAKHPKYNTSSIAHSAAACPTVRKKMSDVAKTRNSIASVQTESARANFLVSIRTEAHRAMLREVTLERVNTPGWVSSRARKVIDSNGVIYASTAEASAAIGKQQMYVSTAIRQGGSYKGVMFAYYIEGVVPPPRYIKKNRRNICSRKVVDSEGVEYSSTYEASKIFGTAVYAALKTGMAAKGRTFKYVS